MASEPKQRNYAQLDERHENEQNAIGQPWFDPGSYVVRVGRCYAISGDPAIWLPETDITYFIAECDALDAKTLKSFSCRSWVNRLRFNGHGQLKGFLVEALSLRYDHHEQITAEICEEVVGPTNPLARTYLSLRVDYPKPTGYLHHRWARIGLEESRVWALRFAEKM